MTRQTIIERTVKAINLLPTEKATEISDFADFIAQRYEDQLLTKATQKLADTGQTFDFLKKEEDIYSLSDLKEVYHD